MDRITPFAIYLRGNSLLLPPCLSVSISLTDTEDLLTINYPAKTKRNETGGQKRCRTGIKPGGTQRTV